MAASIHRIKVGILAEDASDVEVLAALLRKITPTQVFSVRKFVGNGCGRLKNKCNSWANQLAKEGCQVLFLVHDLDRENIESLRAKLNDNLTPCPIPKSLVIIPVEELEAWLLCDPFALRSTFNLKKNPKCPSDPETVNSPKERLAELIWFTSGKTKRYINTIHNVKIAEKIQLSSLRKCKAFLPLEKFWTKV